VSLVLLAYGIGGFFGNLAGGFVVERSLRADISLGALMIALAALALLMFGASHFVTAVSIAVWGFAFGWLPVGFQTWMVRAAPDQAEAAGGLLVTAFQVAITGGAVFGGLLVDGFGPLGAIGYSAVTALAAAILVVAFGNGGLARR
jgi:predicted MFS family arabinose efflux permease